MIFCLDRFRQPSFLESLLIKWFNEFPVSERLKILDLLHRFSMAQRYTGEIRFDFQWLLKAENEYDPVTDSAVDVLCFLERKDPQNGTKTATRKGEP